ncbi:helix-turn-helix transcriptional regulator [Facilibium subflavum]|uniref:helix-turn-helix transcriptional regulator n=1 Tax=Facilibium subflavum TaxID=2219058 RepID=UPI000E64895A|nr:helix-turn-helix transcriptional regulator [Facilibium subflavum]
MNTNASKQIEAVTGNKLTLGKAIWSIRMCEEVSQAEYADRLGVSKQYLSALENDRKTVSVKQAQKFAQILGQSDKVFIELALQDLLDRNHIHYSVDLHDSAA